MMTGGDDRVAREFDGDVVERQVTTPESSPPVSPEAVPTVPDSSVSVVFEVVPRLSLAFHQNGVAVIGGIEVRHGGATDLENLVLRIEAEPPFLQAPSITLSRVRAGTSLEVPATGITMDARWFRDVTEAVRASVTCVLADADGRELVRASHTCDLFAPNEWTGITHAPELVAAFVLPNDPAVDVILRAASGKLQASGRNPALDGYASGGARVAECVEALWGAISDLQVSYALPPAGFERDGQRVRLPSDIVHARVATCLDTTVLFAACLEQMGLHPLVVLFSGHAHVGVWLEGSDLATATVVDAQPLRKRLATNELLLIETTLVTTRPVGEAPVKFSQACAFGASEVAEGASRAFEVAIDIHRVRLQRIRPLSLGTTGPDGAADVVGVSYVMGTTPQLVPASALPTGVGRGEHLRVVEWKRRLLDLSLRNKLLNCKPGRMTVEFCCPDPTIFEDRLTTNNGLRILAKPTAPTLSGASGTVLPGRGTALTVDLDSIAHEWLGRGDAMANHSADDLPVRLIEIHRTVRTVVEETGASTLYLVLGFVSWTAKPTSTRAATRSGSYRAPLLLVPATLERVSVRADTFRLKVSDEPARINPTFLEMMRQDFAVEIPDIDPNAVTDDAGLDVRAIFGHVRTYIANLSGFEVVEDVALSTFSFAKYLMWKQLGDQAEELRTSPVVKRLMDGTGRLEPLPDVVGLDQLVPPTSLRLPLQADSSQVAAVVAATQGRDFVLYGPPGTGKSQTITNLIAHMLGEGKTVLFVSQKATALEVVQRRLKSLNLDPFCLELHSAKAQKAAVFKQLQQAWQLANDAVSDTFATTAESIGLVRGGLNTYVETLHRTYPNKVSAYVGLGRVVAGRDLAPTLTLPVHDAEADTTAMAHARDAAARKVADWFAVVKNPRTHPLRVVARTEWSGAWQAEVASSVRRVADAVREATTAQVSVAVLLETPIFGSPRALEAQQRSLEAMVAHLRLPTTSEGARFLAIDRSALLAALTAAIETRRRETSARDALALAYRDSVWQIDFDAVIDGWNRAEKSNMLLRWLRVGPAWKPVGDHVMPDRNAGRRPAQVGAELRALQEVARLRVLADDTEGALLSGFGIAIEDASAVQAAVEWAEVAVTLAQAAQIGSTNPGHSAWVAEALRREVAGGVDAPSAIAATSATALAELTGARRSFETLTDALPDWAGRDDDDGWLHTAKVMTDDVARNIDDLRDWCDWNAALADARRAGIVPVVEALVAGTIDQSQMVAVTQVAFARGWIDAIMRTDLVLSAFRGLNHQQQIDRFRALDATLTKAASVETQQRLARVVPRRGQVGDDQEWMQLAKQVTLQRGHMPVRKAIEMLPNVFRVLAPCIMMSPVSIAQYLPARYASFDVVIFDEASQLPTWDAVGAIARGKQAIIAGDPKQLPPTNFFDRAEEVSDSDDEIEDLDSVLSQCISVALPECRLRWHYRSRHESLIAFSNERYYEGELITFPSPVTSDRAVRYVHVSEGAYDRGGKRTNRAEADAIVADIVRRLEDPSSATVPSIGVVTFNAEQQRLIQDLLDAARSARPHLDEWFAPTNLEPVFVKNLETVQGDERDVILFSIGYGPDATGRVYMNFGPLNRTGGERRLNVAVTRARRELVVFATLRADQMTMTPSTPKGVRDFKLFLEYAERGPSALVRVVETQGEAVESPFEGAVKSLLEAKGWVIHPQVGVSGYRIDLGIVHPDAPGRYLAGVECDGATYHRAATARDRDRLREAVLRDLGWTLVRVWSTDWWARTDREVDALDASLRRILEEDRRRPAEVAQKSAVPRPAREVPDDAVEPPIRAGAYASIAKPPLPPVVVPTAHPAVTFPRYVVTDFPAGEFVVDATMFYDPTYTSTIRRMVARTIAIEGPINDVVLIERIRSAHGFGRSGQQIRDIILGAVAPEVRRWTEYDERTIFAPMGVEVSQLTYRVSDRSVRDIGDIPIVELTSLARTLDVGNKFDDDAVIAMRDSVGVSRVGGPLRERLMTAIRQARIPG